MFFYHIFVYSQSTLVQQHQFFEYLHSVQHGFVVLPSTTTHVALSRNLGPPRMDWLGGSFRCYVIVHGNGRPLRPFCTIPSFVNVWIRSSPPPLIFTFVKKAEKHRHSQALLAMSVFAFSGQDGVGKRSFVGFCQVKRRQKGRRVTQFKSVWGSVRFGQAGLARSGARAF